jgi:hypothetical protein
MIKSWFVRKCNFPLSFCKTCLFLFFILDVDGHLWCWQTTDWWEMSDEWVSNLRCSGGGPLPFLGTALGPVVRVDWKDDRMVGLSWDDPRPPAPLLGYRIQTSSLSSNRTRTLPSPSIRKVDLVDLGKRAWSCWAMEEIRLYCVTLIKSM